MLANWLLPSLEVFRALNEIPLRYKDPRQALWRIVDLGRQALHSHACALVFVDLDNREISVEAWAGFGAESNPSPRRFRIGSAGEAASLDYDLTASATMAEFYHLQDHGQGVANPRTASRLRLSSLLRCPLKVNGRFLGYFSHFSDTNEPFTDQQKELLGIFAEHAALIIDRFDRQHRLEQTLHTLKSLSADLLAQPEDTFNHLCSRICEFLSVPVCIIWKLDEAGRKLRVKATTENVDEPFRGIELRHDSIHSHGVGTLLDVRIPHSRYQHSQEAKERGWVSLLTAPVVDSIGRPLGRLDVYTTRKRRFTKWEKGYFRELANYTALYFHKEDELVTRRRIDEQAAALEEMTAAQTVPELLAVLLDRSLTLTGTRNGWVSLYHPESQQMRIVQRRGDPLDCPEDEAALELGKGITGLALQNRRAIRVNDVKEGEYARRYKKCWESTRSELAVPLIYRAARLDGTRPVPDYKPVGVLNVESSIPYKFLQADEDILRSLAQHASVLIERLEEEHKRRQVDEIEKQVLGKRDWASTIQTIVEAIKNTLDYGYVNIWLVREEEQAVRSEYFIGVPEAEQADLRERVIPKGDKDIRADIVRTGAIEVPRQDDLRLATGPYEKARSEQFVRVFLPLIASDNRVLGTVEAGHLRRNRPCIYEHDVRILKDFVDYAAVALEQWRLGLLNRILHDFRSPIVGIRGRAEEIAQHCTRLQPSEITSMARYIFMNCEALFYQVDELEYLLARPLRRAPAARAESCDVEAVISHNIRILMPMLRARHLIVRSEPFKEGEPGRERVRIEVDLPRKVIPCGDRETLNKVFHNLLTNSIKYAKANPEAFHILIDQAETADSHVIRFKDRGMGVREGLEEAIFQPGVRAPEAIDREVSGSGLGLTIARDALRALGGDLRLVHNREPTEFHIFLPKRPRETVP